MPPPSAPESFNPTDTALRRFGWLRCNLVAKTTDAHIGATPTARRSWRHAGNPHVDAPTSMTSLVSYGTTGRACRGAGPGRGGAALSSTDVYEYVRSPLAQLALERHDVSVVPLGVELEQRTELLVALILLRAVRVVAVRLFVLEHRDTPDLVSTCVEEMSGLDARQSLAPLLRHQLLQLVLLAGPNDHAEDAAEAVRRPHRRRSRRRPPSRCRGTRASRRCASCRRPSRRLRPRGAGRPASGGGAASRRPARSSGALASGGGPRCPLCRAGSSGRHADLLLACVGASRSKHCWRLTAI